MPADLESARVACNKLTHRGPDAYGEHVSDNVYMGHRRLSILDLTEHGRQPMVTEDGRIGVTVMAPV